jgi:hypothetical protein
MSRGDSNLTKIDENEVEIDLKVEVFIDRKIESVIVNFFSASLMICPYGMIESSLCISDIRGWI